MPIGPVQYVVISFERGTIGNDIDRELRMVRDQGFIRLIGLLFIGKDPDGNVTTSISSDLSPEEAQRLGIDGTGEDLAPQRFGLTSEDLREVEEMIPPDASAAIALFEHLWAVDLNKALECANGTIIAQGLMQPTSLSEIGDELANAMDLR